MKNSDVIKALLLSTINEIAADPGKYAVNPGKDFTRNRKLGFHNILLMPWLTFFICSTAGFRRNSITENISSLRMMVPPLISFATLTISTLSLNLTESPQEDLTRCISMPFTLFLTDGSPTVYFADMGYASYNNFAHVIENGQFFLIRCNDKRLRGILGSPIECLKEMDCRVERILTRTYSKKKRFRPELSEQYRHICQAAPMDCINDSRTEYDISLRIVRFEIMPGCFENIITNLPEREFDFEDFKSLYHMRWDEENSFRDLQYPLCLKAFHSKKYDYIVQEIWARAILHNFSSAIISGVDIGERSTRYKYQVNFAEAFKIYRDFLRIHSNTKIEMEGLTAQNIEPIRPGRTFAHQHRFKLPISFCYRN